MYHARLHPEQYSDTFSKAQLKQLHTSILHVCQTVVDLLGESTKFPEDWLFNHRWGKGKKDAPGTLPNGAKITFLTVGGRTSCVVPSVQKKTGVVAGDVKEESESEAKGGKADTGLVKKKRKKLEEEDEETKESAKATPRARKSRRK